MINVTATSHPWVVWGKTPGFSHIEANDSHIHDARKEIDLSLWLCKLKSHDSARVNEITINPHMKKSFIQRKMTDSDE